MARNKSHVVRAILFVYREDGIRKIKFYPVNETSKSSEEKRIREIEQEIYSMICKPNIEYLVTTYRWGEQYVPSASINNEPF